MLNSTVLYKNKPFLLLSVFHFRFTSGLHIWHLSHMFGLFFFLHSTLNLDLLKQLVFRPEERGNWHDLTGYKIWVFKSQNYINTLFAWPAFMFINWLWGDKTIILGGPKVFGPHKWILRWQKNNLVLPNLNWGDQKCLRLANFHFLVNLGL